MKHNSRTLFTFLAFLCAFSFTIQIFGQPTVRKEGGDGHNGDDCDLNINFQTSQDVVFYIEATDTSFVDSCDLYGGYYLPNSPFEYVEISGFNWVDSLGTYVVAMTVTFSYSDILSLCDHNRFEFGLYCYDDDDYDYIGGTAADVLDICCEEEDEEDTTLPDTIIFGGGSMISTQEIDLFTLDNVKSHNTIEENTSVKSTEIDYFIFDFHGNQITSFKGMPIELNVEQIISNSSIPSGIYFIRYISDEKIKTKKFFKL